MLPAQARLISLAAGFVPNFDAGPSAHAVAVVRALSPAQVWGPAGLACILPRGDGVEKPGSDAVQFLSGHIAAAVLVLSHGS